MDAIQQAFVVESRELLQMMEDNLLQMESNGGDAETINAIFRAAHTIKGGAGVIECKFIVEFTHVLENVLDEMRSGTITPNSELIEVLLACSDQLGALVGCVESETEPGDDVNKASASLREKLQHYLGKPSAATAKDVVVSEPTVHVSGGGEMETDNWHLSLRFGNATCCEKGWILRPSCAT
jgi:two-component system chemotaxis sensor kinase CheA